VTWRIKEAAIAKQWQMDGNATMEQVTPCNITDGSTSGNDVFYELQGVFCWVCPETVSQ
jgi:hypothetical protein